MMITLSLLREQGLIVDVILEPILNSEGLGYINERCDSEVGLRLRRSGFESCAMGKVFSLYIAPVHSAV